jgi:hypothetical protein
MKWAGDQRPSGLTWWSNDAAADIALGMGPERLFNPDRVFEPAIAYRIMSHGMRTGFGFANGRTFSKYFAGTKTNYVGARAMVNGSDSAQEIAKYAKAFEAALFASKQQAALPNTGAHHDLANWDRSAASAWKQGFKTRKRFLAFMKDEYQRWLQERQGCMDREHQTPKACLLEQLFAATAYNKGN